MVCARRSPGRDTGRRSRCVGGSPCRPRTWRACRSRQNRDALSRSPNSRHISPWWERDTDCRREDTRWEGKRRRCSCDRRPCLQFHPLRDSSNFLCIAASGMRLPGMRRCHGNRRPKNMLWGGTPRRCTPDRRGRDWRSCRSPVPSSGLWACHRLALHKRRWRPPPRSTARGSFASLPTIVMQPSKSGQNVSHDCSGPRTKGKPYGNSRAVPNTRHGSPRSG